MANRRSHEELARIVVEQCGWSKITGRRGLTEFDPLVKIMTMVAEEIGLERLSSKPKARSVWCLALESLQEDTLTLEHNTHLPCRYCDRAFEPVIDETLLDLFLAWYPSFSTKSLLAIHRCPDCGGQIVAKRTTTYRGDMHTPPPGLIENDTGWAEAFLENSSF